MSRRSSFDILQNMRSRRGLAIPTIFPFRSILNRLCRLFPLLSVCRMGIHYPIWLFEMEILWMASAHDLASGPFLWLDDL
jgi:hypothetical protein